jgi:hypothetical protein
MTMAAFVKDTRKVYLSRGVEIFTMIKKKIKKIRHNVLKLIQSYRYHRNTLIVFVYHIISLAHCKMNMTSQKDISRSQENMENRQRQTPSKYMI